MQSADLLAVNEQLVLAMLRATADAEKTALRLSEVTRAAHLDALTGLPDRLLFFDRFTQAITHARRHDARLAVLFVDLDRFKEVNDTMGHEVGDRIILASANALVATVREVDTVSRHGGDEFLVLLTEIANANGAEVTARKLLDAVAKSQDIAALGVRLTASIGISVYPDDGQDARALIAHADSAMYRAKKSRNGFATYSSDDDGSMFGQANGGATAVEGSASRPRTSSNGDDRYRQLREANERLLTAALEAQSMRAEALRAYPYRALIDHMEDGAISVDTNGVLLFCNTRFAGLVDVDCDALAGTPLSTFFETVAEAQTFSELLARGPVSGASGDFVLIAAKGTKVPVNITLVGLQRRASADAARIISAIVTDLRSDGVPEHEVAALTTRLRQAVLERGRSERRLEIALEAAGMGSLEVNLGSGTLAWTRSHDRIFGSHRAPNDVMLVDILEQVVPEDRSLVQHAFAEAATSGVIDIEHRIQRADTGATRWIHIKAMALPEDDRPGRLTGVVTDITDRRAVADQLRQAQKMEAVGQLTSGISHDFNNLLLVIGGSIELLARRIEIDERTSRPLESARNAVRRGVKLNQQLLAFSRQQELHSEVLSLDDLVPAFVDLAERATGDTITINVDRLPGAWHCHGDRNQLEIAILNLAINARDAMPEGGVLTLSVANVVADAQAVTTWGAREGEYAAVSVRDTGVGMAPDVMTRAFEPFFSTKAPGLGTGLGLSQVYGFVKQSGGFVSIESELGRGTRMTIHLPRHP